MSASTAHPAKTASRRVLPSATMLGAMALVLYYLIPVAMPPLGFSPHVLAVIAGFVLLLAHSSGEIKIQKYIIPLVFLGTALFSILVAPNAPVPRTLHTWLVSLAAFWLMGNIFSLLPQKGLDVGVQTLLALWILAAIAQVLIGEVAYISTWYGAPIVTVYATGLTIFSNNAAIMLLPLLVWTLVFNLDRPDWRRSLLWLTGCAALYFTLSRAGWLALLIAMLVLALRVRGQPRQIRGLVLHLAFALLAALVAWAAPTRIDPYELGGERSAGRWGTLDSGGDYNSGGDYSGATRLLTLHVAAKAATEYPLTGVGLGHFPDYFAKHRVEYLTGTDIDPRARIPPHNGYAQFVAEAGIPASLLLLLWLGWLLRRAAKSTEPAALALQASIVGMAGWLLFHDGLYDRQLWILLGCATALGVKHLSLRRDL
ncbi:MAG: O-antigen ligase family protein [Thiobacillus sp.]|nr:O-antigen ligase family protein [Thiobacillus sp.]